MSRKRKHNQPPENCNLQRVPRVACPPLFRHCGTNEQGHPVPRGADTYASAAVCILLLLAVVGVFGQTLRHEFVNFDDDKYVRKNPEVVGGLTVEGVAVGLHQPARQQLASAYLALPCSSTASSYGLEPWGHHLTSVLLHAATAVLLFLVLRQMTGRSLAQCLRGRRLRHPSAAGRIGGLGGRTKGRSERAVLHAYPRGVRRAMCVSRFPWRVTWRLCGLFALGLMAKPMLVTLPFVLLLLDYWPLGRMLLVPSSGMGTCRTSAAVALPPQGRKCNCAQRMAGPRRVLASLAVVARKAPLAPAGGRLVRGDALGQGEAIAATQHVSLPWRGRQCRWFPTSPTWDSCSGRLDLAVLYPHPGCDLPLWQVVGGSARCWRRSRGSRGLAAAVPVPAGGLALVLWGCWCR